MSQSPITVTYTLEQILGEIKDSIKEVNGKIDTLQKDVTDLKTDLVSVKGEMETLRTSVKGEMETLRTSVKADIQSLEIKMDGQFNTLGSAKQVEISEKLLESGIYGLLSQHTRASFYSGDRLED